MTDENLPLEDDDELNLGDNIISVTDEDGREINFIELDRSEMEDEDSPYFGNKYIAVTPDYEDDVDILEDDGNVMILKVEEKEDGPYLVEIETQEEYDVIAPLIEDRLIEKYPDGI